MKTDNARPWSVQSQAESFVIYGKNNVPICHVFYDSDSAKRNSELIASAPELLKALKLWKEFWDKMPKGQLGQIVCDIGILNDAFIATGKALAKAKGK